MSNMLPSLSSTYNPYKSVGDPVLTGKSALVFSVSNALADCDNLFISKFRGRVLSALRSVLAKIGVKAKGYRVSLVFPRGNPLKVLGTVIKSVCILVVNFSKFARVWYKSNCDEAVNKVFRWFLVLIKHNHLVSVSNQPGAQITSIGAFVAWLSINTPVMASRIKSLVSRYMLHIRIIPIVYLFAITPLPLFAPPQ